MLEGRPLIVSFVIVAEVRFGAQLVRWAHHANNDSSERGSSGSALSLLPFVSTCERPVSAAVMRSAVLAMG